MHSLWMQFVCCLQSALGIEDSMMWDLHAWEFSHRACGASSESSNKSWADRPKRTRVEAKSEPCSFPECGGPIQPTASDCSPHTNVWVEAFGVYFTNQNISVSAVSNAVAADARGEINSPFRQLLTNPLALFEASLGWNPFCLKEPLGLGVNA
jgi:hypothetical protein